MTMLALKSRLWIMFVVAFVGLLSGCPTSIRSPHDFGSSAVGHSIERTLEGLERNHAIYPKDPSRDEVMKARYMLENGNIVYPIPIVFRRCKVHWEVNPAGIIVGYRYEEVVKGGCNW